MCQREIHGEQRVCRVLALHDTAPQSLWYIKNYELRINILCSNKKREMA